MANVVDDSDVFAEQLCPNTIVEERTLVQDSQPAEIPEHEAHQIQHRSGLQDHRVFARRQLFRSA